MRQRYTCRYIGYISTVSIGVFTVIFETQLFDFCCSRETDLKTAQSLSPLWSILGFGLAGILMQFGRRRILLGIIPLLCGLAVLSFWASSWGLVLLLDALEEVLTNLIFVATVLYTKETSDYNNSGVSLACFWLWREIGGLGVALVQFLSENVYNIKLYTHEYASLRLLLHLVALVPILCQGFLLLFYFQYDSPAYLVSISQDEEALSMLAMLYQSSDVATAFYERMKAIADRNKFSRMTWKKLFSAQYMPDVLGCLLLIFLRSTTGIANGDLFHGLLNPQEVNIRNLTFDCGSVLCLLASLFYIDRLSVPFLLQFGYASAIVLNAASVMGDAIYMSNDRLKVVSSTIAAVSSYPHYLFITIATYKFVAGLLNEKGIACAMVGITLGEMLIKIPQSFFNSGIPEYLRIGLHLVFFSLSIGAYFFTTRFLYKHNLVLEATQERLVVQ